MSTESILQFWTTDGDTGVFRYAVLTTIREVPGDRYRGGFVSIEQRLHDHVTGESVRMFGVNGDYPAADGWDMSDAIDMSSTAATDTVNEAYNLGTIHF